MSPAEMRNHEFITSLINKGANVNFKSGNEGIFPLYLAVDEELTYTVKIADILLSFGAEINAVTKSGSTALHEACSRFFREDENLISFLILKGADMNAEDSNGNTPFLPSSTRDLRRVQRPVSQYFYQGICKTSIVRQFLRNSVGGNFIFDKPRTSDLL